MNPSSQVVMHTTNPQFRPLVLIWTLVMSLLVAGVLGKDRLVSLCERIPWSSTVSVTAAMLVCAAIGLAVSIVRIAILFRDPISRGDSAR